MRSWSGPGDAGLSWQGCDDVWPVEAGVVNDVQQDAEDWRLAWLTISGRTVGCVVGRRGMRIWGRQRRGRMAWCRMIEVGDMRKLSFFRNLWLICCLTGD